jgi:beta-glucanase (GH16 family)
MVHIPTPVRTAVLLTLASTLACGDSPPGTEPDPEVPGEWTLVWADEFDGAALDPNRWSIQTGDGCAQNLCGWGNNELQWYQADNVEVADGLLTLTARVEAAGGRNYTSARIRSLDKGDFLYGRFEIRARLPRGQGIWPAIWMLPTDERYGGWAASGEIDIVELVGHQPARVHGTLHYGGEAPANQSSGDSYDLSGEIFADDFHLFALEWEEGEIRWYVDGVRYQTQTEWSSTAAPFPAPFDQPFHLLLNVAVGGNWPGSPDITTPFPQSMQVDYVRVYRRD